MVMAYLPTAEDLILMKPYRIYKGQKIDIRWSGGWLTPEGVYFPVDYSNGVTHETIAEEHGNQIWGSGSITTRPPLMRIFDIAKWMRITYLEGSCFCVELKGALVSKDYISGQSMSGIHTYQHRRQKQLLNFVKDYREGFESYFINDTEYRKYREFVAAIRSNMVQPTIGDGEASNIMRRMYRKLVNIL
jgi:hypothetical protein